MSTKHKHTPGPWKTNAVRVDYQSLVKVVKIRQLMAGDHGIAWNQIIMLEQNRRELLRALEQAAARIELANAEGDSILSAWLPKAKAAIAKAKGEVTNE